MTFAASNQWPHLPNEYQRIGNRTINSTNVDPVKLASFFRNVAPVMTVIESAVAAVCGVCSTLLIYGASKNVHRMLLPWLIDSIVLVIWCFAEFVVGCSIVGADLLIGLVLITRSLIGIGVSVYFGLIVFALYRQLSPKFQMAAKVLKFVRCCFRC
jgi:hypothetical protein